MEAALEHAFEDRTLLPLKEIESSQSLAGKFISGLIALKLPLRAADNSISVILADDDLDDSPQVKLVFYGSAAKFVDKLDSGTHVDVLGDPQFVLRTIKDRVQIELRYVSRIILRLREASVPAAATKSSQETSIVATTALQQEISAETALSDVSKIDSAQGTVTGQRNDVVSDSSRLALPSLIITRVRSFFPSMVLTLTSSHSIQYCGRLSLDL